MVLFRRRDDPHMLAVRMTDVRMGDRLVQIGCAHGGRLAAIASQVGLSGRAIAVVPDRKAADRIRRGASQAGVLVEVEISGPTRLPAEDAAFDVAVVDDTGGLFATLAAEDRVATVREVARVLRPGGRVMVIGAVPRSGLAGLFTRTQAGPWFDPGPSLQADGFKSVRTLAKRDGLVFVEGIKPKTV